MRYCFACRRMSSSGPICSQCGRSFNGSLCSAGHLNAPGARFCSQCGSTSLRPSAVSFSLGCFNRFFALGVVILGLSWLLGWHIPDTSTWRMQAANSSANISTFVRCTTYSVLNFAIMSVVFYCALYFMASLIPGGVGEGIQKLMSTVAVGAIKLVIKLVNLVFGTIFKVIRRLLGGSNSNST